MVKSAACGVQKAAKCIETRGNAILVGVSPATGSIGNRLSSVVKPSKRNRPDPAAGMASAAASSLPPDHDELSLHECASLVEVQEVSTGIGSVCEEVAVLYANGNVREAEALLEALLADAGHAGDEWPWTMLLDLYRLTGQRERFEARVIDYATRFERSPPPWQDLSAASAPRARSGVAPSLKLAGLLSAALVRQIEQIVVLGERNRSVRVDLASVRDADDEGSALLLDAVARLRRARARVSLSNVDKLVATLSSRIETGVAEQRSVWLLLLELLQHGGDQDRFDALALDYAITFEESPPSWNPVAALPEEADADAGVVVRAAGHLAFEDEITGGGSAVFGRVVALAEERSEIVVDCSRLRRMDFVSAGTLFNVLSTLRGKGRNVTLRGVNAMVLALLHVMGVGQVAKVTPRP
jgi:ABC-type transporter Mla MlaB component